MANTSEIQSSPPIEPKYTKSYKHNTNQTGNNAMIPIFTPTFDYKTGKFRIPHHHDKPSIWSPEEDEELNKLVQQYGHKWTQIAKYFPTKTEIQIKNRWYSNQRREERKKLHAKNRLAVKPFSPPTNTKNNPDPSQTFWDNMFDEHSFMKEFNSLWINEIIY